jgi:glucose-1-phosphate adenylyltransferase
VIFPGVRVGKGALVRDSILMQDTLVGDGCQVEYSIIDKRCEVGDGVIIGTGAGTTVNRKFPSHLDCGITVVGKGVVIPAGLRIGKNCIIYPGVNLTGRGLKIVDDGETIMT